MIIKDEVMLQVPEPIRRNHVTNMNTVQQATSHSQINTVDTHSEHKLDGLKMDTLTAFPQMVQTTPINLNIQLQDENSKNNSS